jgi:hypothetical protein
MMEIAIFANYPSMLKFVRKTENASARHIWRPTNTELSGGGRSLLVEPRRIIKGNRGNRVIQCGSIALILFVPHLASDEVRKSAGLVAAISGAAASSAVPADRVLLVLARYSSDQTPQIKNSCAHGRARLTVVNIYTH